MSNLFLNRLTALLVLSLLFLTVALRHSDAVGDTVRSIHGSIPAYFKQPDATAVVTPTAEPPQSRERTLDIVVSMYRENSTLVADNIRELLALRPIQALSPRIMIYLKDEDADPSAISALKATLNAHTVDKLSNKGREGGTYLSHILLRWDSLATHTLFLQADIHWWDDVKARITDYFVPSTGVLSLGRTLNVCSCTACSDFWDASRTFPRLPQLWSAINAELCPGGGILMGYGGQMIVSRKRILATDRRVYRHLLEVLEGGRGHWIHDDPRQEWFGDSVDEPYFGHTLERAWMTVFGCWDTRLAETCPRIGDRRELADGDERCQCLDPDA